MVRHTDPTHLLGEKPGALPPLSERATGLTGEGALETLARAMALEAQGKEIVHLEIGEPDFPTPPHIVAAGIAGIEAGHTRYGPAPGNPRLREAIANQISQSRQVPVAPGQVFIAPGSKPIVFLTLLALIQPGDEVIVPDPGFPAYAAATRFAGGVPVSMPLRAADGFRVNIPLLRKTITHRTRLLILNSPGNPTGAVNSAAELAELAEVAQSANLWVMADEIYSQIHYTGLPPSIYSLPGMAERTVLVDGFSKAYAMTGWRLGYGVFPSAMGGPITNMMINSHTCVPLFTQEAGLAALQGPQDAVAAMRTEYRARRDLVVAGLNAIPGIHCPEPEGAFYAFPTIDLSRQGLPEDHDRVRLFTNRLLDAGVAVLPGTDFGAEGAGQFRLSYATSRERLAEGLRRIAATVR
jgi:aspartate aminotransferase